MIQRDLFEAGALVYETGAPRPPRRQDIRASIVQHCRDNGLTYVALRQRAQVHRDPDLDPQAVDCLVYPPSDEEATGLIVLAWPYLEYAGRDLPAAQRWEASHLPGFRAWAAVFGDGFRPVLAGLREGRPVAVGLDDYGHTGFGCSEPLSNLL